MRRTRTKILALSMAWALTSCATSPSLEPVEPSLQFAVVGDNPYVDYNVPKYERMITEVNERGDLAWVIHVGDVKGGGQSCSDEFLRERYALNRRFQPPFILTPGDNDWFDCHRESAGGWDPLERLAALRRIYFTDNESFDPGLTRQSSFGRYPDFIENVYWRREGVIFATVHLVGVTPGEGGLDIHARLLDAGLAWLDRVFAEAERTGARGVFLATQVDPWLATILPMMLPVICADCPYIRPGYEPLNDALVEHARRFGKPVVLAVGDTHIFRVDKPLYQGRELVENFTRLEVFGHPNVHWVRVVVNPSSNEVFEFHQELIEDNYGVGWSSLDRR